MFILQLPLPLPSIIVQSNQTMLYFYSKPLHITPAFGAVCIAIAPQPPIATATLLSLFPPHFHHYIKRLSALAAIASLGFSCKKITAIAVAFLSSDEHETRLSDIRLFPLTQMPDVNQHSEILFNTSPQTVPKNVLTTYNSFCKEHNFYAHRIKLSADRQKSAAAEMPTPP